MRVYHLTMVTSSAFQWFVEGILTDGQKMRMNLKNCQFFQVVRAFGILKMRETAEYNLVLYMRAFSVSRLRE